MPPGRVVHLSGRGQTFIREAKGPPGAPTVVLLHGLGATADLNWFTAYGTLSTRFNVVALDQRGHGRGIRPRTRFRLTDCADDVAALVRELDTGPVVAVGYSMGGPVAQLLWHRHPEIVRGLVLAATSRNFRGAAMERLAFGGVGGAAIAARIVPRRLVRRAAQRLIPVADDDPFASWTASQMRGHSPRGLLEAAAALGRFSSHRWIGDVDVPTAVIVTTYDQLVPPRRQYRLASSIDGAIVHEVAADHFACTAAPRRFVPALVAACEDVSR